MKTKNFLRVATIVGLLLLIPVWGNKNVEGWNWTLFDFIWAAVILFSTGCAFEFVVSRSQSALYKIAGALSVLAALMMVWINAAVGIIGDDNPTGLLYLGLVVILVIGSFVVRMKAQEMSRILFTIAVLNACIPLGVYLVRPEIFTPSVLHVVGINAFFIIMWIASGYLFRYAARRA